MTKYMTEYIFHTYIAKNEMLWLRVQLFIDYNHFILFKKIFHFAALFRTLFREILS